MARFYIEDAPEFEIEIEEVVKPIVVAHFLPATSYKGEFGFDWCQWDTGTDKITRFQNVATSEISHVYNHKNNKFEVASTANGPLQQENLKKLYPAKEVSSKKPYYTPWLMLLKGKSAVLDLLVDVIKEGDKDTRFILIEKHKDYDVEYGTQKNELIRIPINKSGKFSIKISAKNETNASSFLKVTTENKKPIAFIELAANKTSTLPVKLIPVVFKGDNQAVKAQSIYKKASEAKGSSAGTNLSDYLNNYAFNQAAIQCDIQAFNEHITIDKDDPYTLWSKFYNGTQIKNWELTEEESKLTTIGFDKRNEGLKKLGAIVKSKEEALNLDPKNKTLKKELKAATANFKEYKNKPFRPEPWLNEDGDYFYKQTDKDNADRLSDKKVLLMNALETEYKRLYPNNNFKGALVFVTDKEFEGNTAGSSEVIPLRNQGVIIANSILQNAPAYVHELGHMLGLNHVFFKDGKEVEEVNKRILVLGKGMANRLEVIKLKEDNLEQSKTRVAYMKENPFQKENRPDIWEAAQKTLTENPQIIADQKRLLSNENNEIEIIKGNRVKTQSSKMHNYMDYSTDVFSFNRVQVFVMKKESNEYY